MSTSAAPIYLHYELRLRSPAIVSALSGDPDSAATQPFIPGSAVRGAMAARLLSSGVDGDSDEFRRLILSNEVRCFHAYPEVAGERSLPCASSWRAHKSDPERALDLAAFTGEIDASVDADDLKDVWPEEALMPVRAPFTAASASAGAHNLAAPEIGSRLHQQRDRVKGRPWTERRDQTEERHGVIFPYEYLEAEQVFRGVIQIMPNASSELERIKRLLASEPILLGRSRRAGYGGQADVEFTGQAAREYENVSGWISHDVAGGTLFRVFLTSAYIGCHPATGQIDPSALYEELCRRLGGKATIERVRWQFEVVGGFNRKWRLEVPQALAVRAGAVLVLRANDAIDVDTLRAIEHEGLGERRAEGFGRVLFLEHSDGKGSIRLRRAEEKPQVEGSAVGAALAEPHRRQLELVEQRIILAAAREELNRVATLDIAEKAKDRPTNSLIGRLRSLFRQVLEEQEARAALANLQTWCSDEDVPEALTRNARENLDRCRIRDESFRQWLRGLAEPGHDQAGWQALVEASGSPATLTALAARSHLTTPDSAKAVLHSHSALLRLHLIDAVLGTMARFNRRGSR